MRSSIRGALVASVVAVGSLGLVLACRDASSPPDRAAPTAPIASLVSPSRTNHSLVRGHLTSAALHKKNRMDWVGVGHGLVLDAFRRQFATGVVTFASACDSVAVWISRPTALAPIASRLTAADRGRMQAAMLAMPECSHHPRRPSGANTAWQAPTRSGLFHATSLASFKRRAAVDDYLGDVESALDAATDADDLASRLSPIYDATATMDTADAWQVQGMVAVAQGSYEYWSDETAYDATEASLYTTYSGCAAGTMNGQTTDPDEDGNQWMCSNQQWLAIKYLPKRRSRSPFQIASNITSATSARRFCGPPSGWGRRIFDGDVEGFLGGIFGGPELAVNAAGAISAYRAWSMAFDDVMCLMR